MLRLLYSSAVDNDRLYVSTCEKRVHAFLCPSAIPANIKMAEDGALPVDAGQMSALMNGSKSRDILTTLVVLRELGLSLLLVTCVCWVHKKERNQN